MKWLDRTFATPAENLACDEALLDLCEETGVEVLRCWESRQAFVVVGYGNRVASEVNVEECRRRGVPILRRCSGGGTVVQGPGCLNYNLTLKISDRGLLTTVTGTNQFIMERNRAALENLLGTSVAVMGHTDLAFARAFPSHAKGEGTAAGRSGNLSAALANPAREQLRETASLSPSPWGEGRGEGEQSHLSPAHSHWHKFSGNAQRRRRHALVFHGTILHGFDLPLVEALLRFPSAQPEYRAHRSHTQFVRNIPATAADLRAALRAAWRAEEKFPDAPPVRLEPLLRDHYLNESWNRRR